VKKKKGKSPLLQIFDTIMASVVVVQTSTSSAPTRRPSFRPMNAASTHKDTAASQSGANYFFGVLLAFAVIVLTVVACGITSSRRSSSRRRRALRLQSWGSHADDSKGEVEPPRFYETGYRVVQDAGWKAMMVRWTFFPFSHVLIRQLQPLSAAFLGSEQLENSSRDEGSTEILLDAPHPPTCTRQSASRFLSRFKPKTSSEPTTAVPPVAIQTVILVALPFRAKDLRAGDDSRSFFKIYPEIQIGVETLTWMRSHYLGTPLPIEDIPSTAI
jgi:hypothetical protein